MTKQTHILNMSFLPIVLLIALILGAGYFLLAGDIDIAKLLKREPEVRRLAGFPTVINTTEILEKQRTVIKSEQELATFLNSVDKSGLLTLNEKINFDKEFLIGVASKTFEETGSTVKVRKLYEDKENKALIVSIKQIDSGENCEIEAQPNVAVDLVAVSKTDWQIKFDTIKETKVCNN